MMLFKLSLKNIKKSFRDYAIYFFTLILGVSIFYVFNAIESQTIMMDISSSTYGLIELMLQMMDGVSVFVSLILGFLIIYASQFLMKRRNKEFGIYLTLGMSKRKISTILFFETLCIGILSPAAGLALGAGLSQLMSLLVANMFEADLTKFQFIFSGKACVKTLIYFSIMYLLVMVFNTINVNRCKLIDLLYASRRSETVKMKNPILCIIVFLLSACALGYAYYQVSGGVEKMSDTSLILIIIAIGIVSTFFLFWSLSGLLLKIFMSMKRTYYKGLNSFTLRQVSSKINTTVFSMTIICLMLFVTICVLSSALSIKNSMTANLTELAPVDVELTKDLDLGPGEYTDAQIADSKISTKETMQQLGFDTDKYLTDTLDFNIYSSDEILTRDTLGGYYETALEKYPTLLYDSPELLVKQSDYNKIAKLFHQKAVSLKENQYAIIADYEEWVIMRDQGLETSPALTLSGKTYTPAYDKCISGFIEISANHINFGFVVLPDDAVNESMRMRNVILGNYQATTKEGKQETEDALLAVDDSPYAANTTVDAMTKLALYESSIGLGALITFIGLYLGIIFLISSAALLALKELSESSDNRERFQMLRRLGTDEKMLDRALFRQIGIFFLFPLLIAVIHSIFGIRFCNYILESFGNSQLLVSIIITSIFLIVIYGGYFILTYLCSRNMMRD